MITSCASDRFNQPSFKSYARVESLLLKAAAGEQYLDNLNFVINFYGTDFDSCLLSTHLQIFFVNYDGNKSQVTVGDVLNFFITRSSAQVELMSQVGKLLRLLL